MKADRPRGFGGFLDEVSDREAQAAVSIRLAPFSGGSTSRMPRVGQSADTHQFLDAHGYVCYYHRGLWLYASVRHRNSFSDHPVIDAMFVLRLRLRPKRFSSTHQ